MASSVIDSYDYNAATSVLTIVFTTGRVYAYEDVPPQVAEAFRFANSKGRYFNEYIRDRFRPTEMTEVAPKPSATIIPFRPKRDE